MSDHLSQASTVVHALMPDDSMLRDAMAERCLVRPPGSTRHRVNRTQTETLLQSPHPLSLQESLAGNLNFKSTFATDADDASVPLHVAWESQVCIRDGLGVWRQPCDLLPSRTPSWMLVWLVVRDAGNVVSIAAISGIIVIASIAGAPWRRWPAVSAPVLACHASRHAPHPGPPHSKPRTHAPHSGRPTATSALPRSPPFPMDRIYLSPDICHPHATAVSGRHAARSTTAGAASAVRGPSVCQRLSGHLRHCRRGISHSYPAPL